MKATPQGLLAPALAAIALLFASLTPAHAAAGAGATLGSMHRLAAAQAGPPEGVPTTASLQVAHLAPFAAGAGTSVTVALNGAPALTNVLYGNSTAYIELPPGAYTVDIIPTGAAAPAITANAVLAAGGFYTAIAVGNGTTQPLSLVLLEDNPPPAPGQVLLRLGHLAPFAAGAAVLADVRLQDGTPILEGVTFTDVSPFLALPPGSYDLAITAPGGTPILIDPLPVTLTAGQVLSAFATGDGSNQPLGAFALPVGAVGAFLPLGTTPPPAPVVRPVPTAATWALLALALALAAFAAGVLRRRSGA